MGDNAKLQQRVAFENIRIRYNLQSVKHNQVFLFISSISVGTVFVSSCKFSSTDNDYMTIIDNFMSDLLISNQS